MTDYSRSPAHICSVSHIALLQRITAVMSVNWQLRSIPIVLWATIVDGRITWMKAYFDGREYDALFEK